jgi:hypothetical protein
MRGREKVYFCADSMLSFAMARLKGDPFEIHLSEEELRASLGKGGRHHKYIVKGGSWWRHREMWIARRDGDTARLKELEIERNATWITSPCGIGTSNETLRIWRTAQVNRKPTGAIRIGRVNRETWTG